jgi:hypothetical protein
MSLMKDKLRKCLEDNNCDQNVALESGDVAYTECANIRIEFLKSFSDTLEKEIDHKSISNYNQTYFKTANEYVEGIEGAFEE